MSSDCATNDSRRWCAASHSKMSKGREEKTGSIDGFSFVTSLYWMIPASRCVGMRAGPTSTISNKLKSECETKRSPFVKKSTELQCPKRLLDHLASCDECWRRLRR